MNPFSFEHLAGGPRLGTLPAEHGNAVAGRDKLARLENQDLLDFGNAHEPLGDIVLCSKRPGIGKALGAAELPFDLVGDEIEYRRNVATAECPRKRFGRLEVLEGLWS